MARPTIAAIRSLSDFQKTYYWDLVCTSPSTYFTLPSTTAADRMNLQCISSDVPKFVGDTATFKMKGFQIHDPGIYVPEGSITLTFLEMTDSTIRSAWDFWIQACANKTGTFARLYSNFLMTTSNNQELGNYAYNLKYCFPDATSPAQLESESSSPMNYTVTLRYTDLSITNLVSNPAIGGGTVMDYQHP